jgi:hypothetical protein
MFALQADLFGTPSPAQSSDEIVAIYRARPRASLALVKSA